MPDPLAYIAHVKTCAGLLSVISHLTATGMTWKPGELQAIERRANDLGGAGHRDVLKAVREAKG
jgi:hypothetical protein